MEEEKFDGLIITLIQNAKGIDGLFNVLFSTLRRKTDFFSDTTKSEEVLLKHYNFHKERYLGDKELIERQEKEKRERELIKQKEREEQAKKMASQPKSDSATVEEVTEEEAQKIEEIQNNENKAQDEETEKKEDLKINDEVPIDEDDKEPPPTGNGGQTDKYVWTQTLSEVSITVPVPVNIVSKMLDVKITTNALKVAIKGQPPIIDGKFPEKIKAAESLWTLDEIKGGKIIQISFEKFDGMHWWDCAIQGDPKINTQKIQPENSKLSELDPETRSTVEKMMFDQQRKAQGLPTSDEMQKNDMLKKFMDAHPEMDFSKAKIN